MYSDKSIRDEEWFEFPRVNRKLEFSSEEILTDGYYGGTDSDEEEAEAILVHGTGLYILNNITPVVRYESENSVPLNCFVESVSVDIVKGYYSTDDSAYTVVDFPDGWAISVDHIENEAIAYVCTRYGGAYEVEDEDLSEFLLQKPKLVVTNEGALVFYNSEKIIATLDCQSGCNVVDVSEIVDILGKPKAENVVPSSMERDEVDDFEPETLGEVKIDSIYFDEETRKTRIRLKNVDTDIIFEYTLSVVIDLLSYMPAEIKIH